VTEKGVWKRKKGRAVVADAVYVAGINFEV